MGVWFVVKFVGDKESCGSCAQREKCLHSVITSPDKTPVRQVSFMHKEQHPKIKSIEIMKTAIDSEAGRKLYGKRMRTVEPVFGNLRSNKGLDRFTLRGQDKVNTQWNLYCLVHNIEKLAHHGYGAS